jgi:hypothetical protein
MRKLLLLPFLGCFLLHAEAPQSVFVEVSGISTKNVGDFQLGADQLSGIHYLGYCNDLKVVHFKVNREDHPTDSVLIGYFKSFGLTSFSFKESVTDRQFSNNCQQFEPRQ